MLKAQDVETQAPSRIRSVEEFENHLLEPTTVSNANVRAIEDIVCPPPRTTSYLDRQSTFAEPE